ncbi:MAG: oxidoreductase [Bacteroidota bacterium]
MAKKTVSSNTNPETTSQQKIALVTGGSSGIGKATVLELYKQGYKVYAAARNLDKMKDLEEQGISIIQLDVTDEKATKSCIDQVIKKENKIDVLVNGAGMGVFGSVEETSMEDAHYQFDVNLFGMARLTKYVVPHMRKRKAGTIVNISSMIGKFPVPLGAYYIASKHAVEGWSDCLRIELEPFNIRVIIIEPGVTKTGFGEAMKAAFLARSSKGPYQDFIFKPNQKKEASEPTDPLLVAETIAKAISNSKPATRYPVGKDAKYLLWLRKWVSDRYFDKVVKEKF